MGSLVMVLPHATGAVPNCETAGHFGAIRTIRHAEHSERYVAWAFGTARQNELRSKTEYAPRR